VLELSFKEIVRRHEALRTTFATVDGQPVQVVGQKFNFGLQVLDLQQLAETEREEKVKQLAAEEASKPFDLTKGPLLRASLLQLDAEEYVLLLTLHHIIFDGWSIGVFLQELAALYEAFLMANHPHFPNFPYSTPILLFGSGNGLRAIACKLNLTTGKSSSVALPPC